MTSLKSEPADRPLRRTLILWRSSRLAYVVILLALIVGVPLFLCMPPWIDVTLYDVAARNIVHGGVHYRDVFDTNLPGMPWLMVAIRALSGSTYEALRAWDLAIAAGSALLLSGWLRHSGVSSATRAWFLVGIALFYPFTSEFSHCQRDPWLLLPAVLAAQLRLRQVTHRRDWFIRGMLEGFLWGVAVWIKPHVLVPALTVWIASRLLIPRRGILIDAFGLLCGGLLAALPGVLWLMRSGAWRPFLDVFLNWNPEYTQQTMAELPERLATFVEFFRPWGLMHLAAIPLAFLSFWEARRNSDNANRARVLLAALYLGWLFQAVVLQRGFDYVRVPDTFLALAVLSSRGWAVGFVYFVWFLAVGLALNLCVALPRTAPWVNAADPRLRSITFEKHPLLDARLVRMWPRCWKEGSSPALRDQLGWYVDVHCGTKWTDLEGVAVYLRTVQPPVGDRELTCWNDSTHPLYLMLDLEPSTRYMHFGTVLPLQSKEAQIRHEVARCPQRYVVSDLHRMCYDTAEAYAPGADGPLSLPAWFPVSQRGNFPWDQPIVFRSGRYLVHRIDHQPQPEQIVIPDWQKLDDLGPGVQP